MKPEELRPGDVLLTRAGGYGFLNPLVRWLMTWGHAFIYFTETRRGLPLVIESIGRGVLIRSLYCYAGKTVRVMRPRVIPPRDSSLGEKAAKAAERLADNPKSFYGYFDIPRYVLPKLLLQKLARWLPRTSKVGRGILARTYRRNSVFICSELVAQAYREAGSPLVEDGMIPMPDDLVRSAWLTLVGDLKLPPSDAMRPG